MRRLEFTDIGDLFKFHNSELSRQVLLSKARSGRTHFFLNEEETAYLDYDGMFGGRWIGHITSLPEARGKGLWNFAYETARWMVEYASLSELFCFVSKDDKLLRLFVSRFKMPYVGEFAGMRIYAVDDKQIIEFKEVELCQQQFQ